MINYAAANPVDRIRSGISDHLLVMLGQCWWIVWTRSLMVDCLMQPGRNLFALKTKPASWWTGSTPNWGCLFVWETFCERFLEGLQADWRPLVRLVATSTAVEMFRSQLKVSVMHLAHFANSFFSEKHCSTRSSSRKQREVHRRCLPNSKA